MFIPDPDFLPSQISDLGFNKNKKEEVNQFFVLHFFVAINFAKWKIILLWKGTKKFEPVYKEFLSLTQTIVTNLRIFQKYGFVIRDPEKNLSWIPERSEGRPYK